MEVVIECDENQYIVSCNEYGYELLGYEREDLVGKHITILMSRLVDMIHRKIFEMIKSKNWEQIAKLSAKIRSHKNNLRHFYVYDSQQNPILCSVDIHIMENLHTIVKLSKMEQYLSPLVPQKYLQYLDSQPTFHVDKYENVVCIMMDIANSTEICAEIDACEIANIYHNIYKIASTYVNTHYYPYAYIHETCGDSLFIVVNAEYIKKFDLLCATIALHISYELQEQIDRYLEKYEFYDLYIRCGVVLGDVCGGIIDGKTFRLFGSAVHMASRLESKCKRRMIMMNENLVNKVYQEMGEWNKITSEEMYLKGFGVSCVFQIRREDVKEKLQNMNKII